MEPSESQRRQIHRAYRKGRGRHAALYALLTLPVSALALSLCHHPLHCLPPALLLFALAGTLAWQGRGLTEGIFPGLLAGSFPLMGMLVARFFGHICLPGFCMNACLPACIVGGLAAGIVATRLGSANMNLRRLGATVLIGGTTLAMGCAATGLGGALGLGLGVALGLSPQIATGLRRS